MALVDTNALRQSTSSSIQQMTGPQRVTLALAFVATALGLFVVAQLAGRTTMSTLYAGMEPADAAAIVDRLEGQGIAYELTDGGRTIKVPADQVHEARLDVSAEGLVGGSDGWSILDDQGITTSAFDQRVGYQRAMEGELARTIAAIDGVSRANVHLVIPENDLILDSSPRASASVLVVQSGADTLGAMQVEAIVNLVASSVEGLTPDQVSVADETGRVLAAAGEGAGIAGLEGDNQLRAKRDYESLLESDLEALLAAVVGPGLAVVNVSADLDFDSVTTVTEQYQPAQSATGDQMLLSETTRNELIQGEDDGAAEGGELEVEEPDPAEPVDEAAAPDDGLLYSLDERDARFAVDKVITNAENSGGGVTALSVAVLLDEAAVDAAKVPEIEALVSAAAGIDDARGDTLAVTLIPINEQFRAGVEALAFDPEAEVEGAGMDLVGLIRTVGTVLVAIVVAVFGIRMVSKGPKTETVDSVDMEELKALMPSGDLAELAAAGETVVDIENLEALISNQTDDVAGVLRSWLNEAEEVAR